MHTSRNIFYLLIGTAPTCACVCTFLTPLTAMFLAVKQKVSSSACWSDNQHLQPTFFQVTMECDTWLLGSETSGEGRLLSHQPASDLWTGQCFWGAAATFPQKLQAEVNQCWHKTALLLPRSLLKVQLYVTFLPSEVKTVNEGLSRVTYSKLYC